MKKQKRKLYKTNQTTDLEYNRIIKISVGVAAVLIIVYLVTAIASGEIKFGNKKTKPVKQETSIQYQEIIAGETFNRNSDEYYVLFYKKSDSYAEYYSSLVTSFKNKNTIYTVDLDQGINEKYLISENEEVNTKDINSLKVENPTLIKIKNKKSVETISGREKVIEFFEKN